MAFTSFSVSIIQPPAAPKRVAIHEHVRQSISYSQI
jgi:hypothetical protein